MGAFTRHQAAGCLANGTRVVKARSEESDAHPDGTPGVILGSLCTPEVMAGAPFYFVEWAPRPRVAVGVMGFKVREVPA